MKTIRILSLLVALGSPSLFILTACQKEASDNNTTSATSPTLKVYLTDHQTPIFDSVFIDIQKLEVKLEDDTMRNGGWVNLPINAGIYNILRLRNGIDTLFSNVTLPNDRVRKLRLTLGTQNSAVHNNLSYPLRIKDNNRQVVIDITGSNFDVTGGQMHLWLDFDAGNSINVDNSGQGNNNGYELNPHINAFGKHNTGRIEGRITPLTANPIVKAVIGTDTATAIPNNSNGEFKIVGLRAGVYTVIIDGQNNYVDTTINNVRVVSKEDTKLPAITLHQ